MASEIILGTAGHIDHGKTALVEALTGVNCDRLPEEKRRGITIELGFADLTIGSYRVGVVDVPGHEKFIRTMLAGACGMDLVMLIVAADDGIMPQSREHYEIIRLLGVRAALVVLTKCDLVDPETLHFRELELREWLKGGPFAHAPIVRTSVRSGTGLTELRQVLEHTIGTLSQRAEAQLPLFRLAVDRVFSRPGFGTIVTGTVASGQFTLGQDLAWYPQGVATATRVGVRGLHQHGQAVPSIVAGQRAALNLLGVEQESIRRGDTLASGEPLRVGRWLAVAIEPSPDKPFRLKHRATVHLHLGTAEAVVRLLWLQPPKATAEPATAWPTRGATVGYAILGGPWLPAVYGQRFVLRDPSGQETLGGGIVLLPQAPRFYRRRADRWQALQFLAHGTPEERVLAWANLRAPADVETVAPASDLGLTLEAFREARQRLLANEQLIPLGSAGVWSRAWVAQVEPRVRQGLLQLHGQQPLLARLDRAAVEAELAKQIPPQVLTALMDWMLSQGSLLGDRRRIAEPTFQPKLTAAQRQQKNKLIAMIRAGGLAPPDLAECIGALQPNRVKLSEWDELAKLAVAEGELILISPGFYLHPSAFEQAIRKLEASLAGGPATLARLRDSWGITRKHAIPLAEYFDAQGWTRRDGDFRHWVGRPS